MDGCAPGLLAAGGDELHDGFRLGEIKASVEKGPPRKLSGIRKTHGPGEHQGQHAVGNGVSAVQLELSDILARIAVRGAHEDAHAFVDDFLTVHDMTIVQMMAVKFRHSLCGHKE